MKRISLLFFIWFFLTANIHAASSSLLPSMKEKLAIQNRVLAHINDKTITVIDVMQKMTLFLSSNYPEESKSPLMRTQFFITNWREFLGQMIDQELILADANSLEIKISDKDIRELMLDRFGPNVMSTLDKIGLPYEKAKEFLHNEIAIERMQWYRVHSKAYEKVSPKHIKHAYKEYVASNPPTKEWEYQVLSIRSNNREKAMMSANKAYTLLTDKQVDFHFLPEHLKDEELTISLSDTYHVKDSELSKTHKEALSQLKPGCFSTPKSQVSRFDNCEVFRLFFVRGQTTTKPKSFEEMEHELREKLFNQAISEGTSAYVAKLRKQYGYDKKSVELLIPEEFQPFSLQ